MTPEQQQAMALAAARKRMQAQSQVQGAGGENLPPLSPQQVFQRQTGVEPDRTIYDNPNPAGPIDALRFATIEDPQVRMQKFAEQRFPNEAPEQRDQRYGIVGGDVVYRGPDGRVYREISGPVAGTADVVGKFASQGIGSIVGLMLGGPAGSAVGGMAGLGYRKLAGLAQGDQQTATGNAADLAIEGTIDYAVPKVGGMLARNVYNRAVVRDLGQFDEASASALQEAAKRYGITLTPAEITNLGSLIGQQNRYSMGMDPAGDVMKRFYGQRGETIAKVVDDFVKGSPDLDVAGAAARRVAGQAIDDAQTAVTTGSRSAYKSVVSPQNLVPENRFMEIDADPLINKYLNMVKEAPEYGLMDAPRNSTAVIDAAGKLMREEAARLSGTPGMRGQVTEGALTRGRQRLLNFMEESFPAYKDARTAQATMRATHLDPLTEGIEGVIARTKDTALAGIPKKLLAAENVSPASVANWRREFVSQGMEGDWDNLVGAYLRKVWEGTATKGRSVKDLSGARFREMVFGTPSQQKIMREAMGPDRFRDFSDLMDVLEATGRANARQSMTQPAMEAARRDTAMAMTGPENLIVGAARTDVTSPLRRVADWWADARTQSWRLDLANVLTSPDAMKALEDMRVLREMSPTAQRKVEVALQALTKAGVVGGASVGQGNPQQVPLAPQ